MADDLQLTDTDLRFGRNYLFLKDIVDKTEDPDALGELARISATLAFQVFYLTDTYGPETTKKFLDDLYRTTRILTPSVSVKEQAEVLRRFSDGYKAEFLKADPNYFPMKRERACQISVTGHRPGDPKVDRILGLNVERAVDKLMKTYLEKYPEPEDLEVTVRITVDPWSRVGRK